MSDSVRPWWRRLLSLLLVPLLAGVVLALYAGLFLQLAVAPPAERLITIPPGTPFSEVARELKRAGVVSSARTFTYYAQATGAVRRVKAGEYLFREAATPGQVLKRLIRGDVHRYPVTFPEGFTLREIAQRLEATGLCTADDFLAAASDPDLLRALDIPGPSAEGYLFPETYQFPRHFTPEQLLRRMVEEFRRRLPAELTGGDAVHGLSLHQLVILASIIQKESGLIAEMPLISAVFHNRLRLGMPLQADPTVIYGIPDFDGNLTRAHLREPGPYNTYRLRGLPAGPISNPGLDALRAAAAPADSSFLYFVARGDGSHVFTATLSEHNAAVRRYQLKRP